jgi:serine protease Do
MRERRCRFRRGVLHFAFCILTFAFLSFAATLAQAQDPPRDGYRLAPKAFRAAVERIKPSLVTIEAFGGIGPSAGKTKRGGGGISQPGDGPTTGLIISPDGHIATSTFNFIRKPPIITVILPDGTRKVAKLLGRDETCKLCLLKVDGVTNLAVPTWAPPEEIRVGQWAITVGVGYGGDEPAVSVGIISATRRVSGKAVQTDANISPANYGGPLLDLEGRVIGVCAPLSPMGQGDLAGVEWYDSGIGFAVPLAGREKHIARLKAGETLLPGGQLGVQLRTAAKDTAAKEAAEKDASTPVIESVAANSPAAKADLKTGDRIVSFAGEKVFDNQQLGTLVRRYYKGDTARLEVRRGEQTVSAEVTFTGFTAPQPKKPSKFKVKTPDKKKPRPPEPE